MNVAGSLLKHDVEDALDRWTVRRVAMGDLGHRLVDAGRDRWHDRRTDTLLDSGDFGWRGNARPRDDEEAVVPAHAHDTEVCGHCLCRGRIDQVDPVDHRDAGGVCGVDQRGVRRSQSVGGSSHRHGKPLVRSKLVRPTCRSVTSTAR